jgi:hypothetical protein
MTMSDFDARAATWDDDPAKVERAQAVADAIVRSVPLASAMRAMEYGCGTGLLSFMLRPRLGEVTLADLDAEDGSFHGEGFDGHLGCDRVRLGAQAREAGLATVEFWTACEIERKVDGRPRRYPVFRMVAQKASGGARGGRWRSSND